MAKAPKHACPCPYCKAQCRLVKGTVLFPGRAGMQGLWFYQCQPCAAWGPSEAKTKRPLPSVVKQTTRNARKMLGDLYSELVHMKSEAAQISNLKASRLAWEWLVEQAALPPHTMDMSVWLGGKELLSDGDWEEDQCNAAIAVIKPALSRIKKFQKQRRSEGAKTA